MAVMTDSAEPCVLWKGATPMTSSVFSGFCVAHRRRTLSAIRLSTCIRAARDTGPGVARSDMVPLEGIVREGLAVTRELSPRGASSEGRQAPARKNHRRRRATQLVARGVEGRRAVVRIFSETLGLS